MRKKPYPRNSDIVEAIKIVASRYPFIGPEELPFKVVEILEDKGFFTGHVTDKRIWRLYAEAVKRGLIPNFLEVTIKGGKNE
ncbi:hypothetical protein DRO02_04290 [archaeon]|nr:MAG: hypothetical protein DRO02_04290 [archaeon]HDM23504.1 hypothetical protein [Candidatus Bathyarchaeota archaeon]